MTRPRRKKSGRRLGHNAAAVIASIFAGYLCAYSCFAHEPSQPQPCFKANRRIVPMNTAGAMSVEVDLELSQGVDLAAIAPQIYRGDTYIPGTLSRPNPLDPQSPTLGVAVTFNPGVTEPGFWNVQVASGDHIHIQKNVVYVAPRPTLNGTACGGQSLALEAGEAVSLDLSQLDADYLRAEVDDQLASIDAHGQLTLPQLTQGDHRLILKVVIPGLDSVVLCEDTLQVGDHRLQVSELSAIYDPAEQKFKMRLVGTGLPTDILGIINPEDPDFKRISFRRVAGDERNSDYSSQESRPIAQRSGVYQELEIEHAAETLYKTGGRWVADSTAQWRWQSFRSPLETELYDLHVDERYGRIKLPFHGEEYAFARVPVDEYKIGLSKERSNDPSLAGARLFALSAHRGGVVKLPLVQPFLIGAYEITNRQFLSWVRAVNLPDASVPQALRPYVKDSLPPSLAELPVTGVSYDEARRFARWLQGQLETRVSGWQIRLPHEVEWEMAARAGGSQDYVFHGNDVDDGLASLADSGPRPIGTNAHDRSSNGARDMTGNVREWTASVLNEQMLNILKIQMALGQQFQGWDPRSPHAIVNLFEEPPEDIKTASKNMVVRGGANGEEPKYFLISLRRQLEMASRADDVGFRLVLIPMDER